MPPPTKITLSLAPGFSPVFGWSLTGLAVLTACMGNREAAKAAQKIFSGWVTGLKPGANDRKTHRDRISEHLPKSNPHRI